MFAITNPVSRGPIIPELCSDECKDFLRKCFTRQVTPAELADGVPWLGSNASALPYRVDARVSCMRRITELCKLTISLPAVCFSPVLWNVQSASWYPAKRSKHTSRQI